MIEYKGVTIRRYKYMMLPCTVRACRYEADVNGLHLTANTRKEIDTLVSKALKNMIIGTEKVKAVLEKHQKWCDEGMDETLPSKKSPRADLHGFYMRDVKIPNANLRKAILYKCSLRGADLSGADLREADLRGADLIYADLSGADLTGADLAGACLSGAKIENMIFSDANMPKAVMNRAEIRNSDFRKANLCGAGINLSDIEGSNFDGADMSGICMAGNIRNSSFHSAKIANAKINIRAKTRISAAPISLLPIYRFQHSETAAFPARICRAQIFLIVKAFRLYKWRNEMTGFSSEG